MTGVRCITSSSSNKKSDNTITISITTMNNNHAATSSHSARNNSLNVCRKRNPKAAKSKDPSKKSSVKQKKKLKLTKLSASRKVVFAPKKAQTSTCLNQLFDYDVYSSSEEDDVQVKDGFTKSYPMVTMSTTLFNEENDFEISELRSQLISQKWLLSNLVKLKEMSLKDEVVKVQSEIKKQHRLERTQNLSYLDVLLKNKERIPFKTSPEALRRGTCCFSDEIRLCSKPSLPFTRHCKQHILYNVDQMLFERCTAKSLDSLTPCSNPTFNVDREEPLCRLHQHTYAPTNERNTMAAEDSEPSESKRTVNSCLPISQKGRKKGKPLSLTRPGRRSTRKKRSSTSGKGGGSVDSVDGNFLSQDSSDATVYNGTSDSCDMSASKYNLTPTSLPCSWTATTAPTGIPSTVCSALDSVPSSEIFNPLPIIPHTVSRTSSKTKQRNTPNSHQIPASLDVGVPNLAPGDEALVASLVADLPPLGAPPLMDTDLIPDDAFNELFMDNLKNGDIPSKEEAEALEQALAAVSKDVHSLADAAAVVISVNPTNQNGGSLNGDTPHYAQPANGVQTSVNFHSRPGATTPLNMTETDILGLANNILGSLTAEQQQQLNGLIDGALASGSLASSPSVSAGWVMTG